MSDIDEIKAEYLEGLTFHYVKEMSEVLAVALTGITLLRVGDIEVWAEREVLLF